MVDSKGQVKLVLLNPVYEYLPTQNLSLGIFKLLLWYGYIPLPGCSLSLYIVHALCNLAFRPFPLSFFSFVFLTFR